VPKINVIGVLTKTQDKLNDYLLRKGSAIMA